MCIVTVDCSISGWLVHEIGNALAILHAGMLIFTFFEFFIHPFLWFYLNQRFLEMQTRTDFLKMALNQYMYFL